MSSSERQPLSKSSLASLCTTCKERSLSDKKRIVCQGSTCNKWSHLSCLVETTKYSHTALRALFNDRSRVYLCDICVSRNEIYVLLVKAVEYKKWKDHPKYKKQKDFSYLFLEGGVIEELNQCLRGLLDTISVDNKSNIWVKKTHETVISAILDRSDPLLDKERDSNDPEWMTDETRQHLDTFSHVYRRYNKIPDQKNKEAVYIARNKYNAAARTVRGVYNHIAFHEKKIRNVMRHCIMSLYEKYSTRTVGDQRNAFEKEFCEFFTNITYRNDMMKVQKYVESEASGSALTEMITLHNLYVNEGGLKTHKSSPKDFQKVGGLVKMKKKKKKKKVYESLDSGSEDEGIDTDVKLYPLSHYINDQEEMVAQMFATIRGSKLLAMLPPALKSVPLKELKHLCLHELCGMSKKRILCIINGQEMEGSSEEEEEEEDEEENEEKEERRVTKVVENEIMTSGKAANKQDKRKIVANEGQSFLLKKIKVEPGLEDKPEGSQTGKSVMELLELEMRARLIKTMLDKGEDGKKITEDAIAAVMNSATQLSIVADMESLNGKEKVAATSVKGKSCHEGGTMEEGTDDDRESERGSRGSHRKHFKSRRSSRRRRRRRDDNVESDRKRKAKDQEGTEKCTPKKKRITRREFEERMKRAKKNRNYRQHNTEEDEHKERESESQENDQKELDNKEMAGTEQKEDVTEDSRTGNKTGEETWEVSEKEEGEWDSNEEEEEGACTPSDISSKSSCYSSSYSSRSRSRSYSRSPSRTQRRRRRRSYSRSRSRSRRSCTRSRSRSRSVGKRVRNDGKRKLERKAQNPEASSLIKSKGTVVKLPLASQKQASKEEEDNWGQKCDIEFVDSEEDFDDIPSQSSVTSKSLRSAKAQGIERASISFSLQKKQGPTITPNVDLDDLPLKSGVVSSTSKSVPLEVIDVDKVSTVKKSPNVVEIIDVDKPLNEKPEAGEEILISSDSEGQECISSISAKPRATTETSVSNTASKSKAEVNINTSTEPKVAGELGISNTLSDSDDKAGQPSHRNEGGKDDIVLDELDKDKIEKKNLDLDYSVEIKTGKSEQSLGHKLDNQQRGEEDDDLNMGQKVNENDKKGSEVDNVEAREQACFFTKDLKGPGTHIIAKPCNVETESDVQLESQKSNVKVVQIDASPSQLADTEELGEKDAENSTFAQNSKKEQKICDDSQLQEDMPDPQTKPVCTDKEMTTDKRSKHTNTTEVEVESSIRTRRHGRLDSAKILPARKVTTKRSSVKERISKKDTETVDKEKQLMDDKETAASTEKKTVNDTEATKELLDEIRKTEDVDKQAIHKDCDRDIRDKEEAEDAVENTTTADEAAQSKEIVLIEEQMENVHENVEISETNSNKESSDAMDVKVCDSKDTEKLPEFESENKTVATDNEESEGRKTKCQNDLISVSLEEIIRVSLSRGKTKSVRNKNVALEKGQMSSITVKEKLEDTDQSEHISLSDESLMTKETTSTHHSKPIRTESGPIRKHVLRPKKVEIKMPLTNVDTEENEIEGIVSVESKASKEVKKDGIDLVKSEQEKKDIESTSFDHDSPNPGSLQMKSSHPQEESDSDEHEMKVVDTKMKDQKETDIIGVIEASNASASMCDEDIDLGGSSWSMRWLQSDKVQKVVTSSKMLSRVRKKIQKKGMATKKIASENIECHHKKATESPVQVIGSIEEYERMFGVKGKTKTKEETKSQPQQLVPQENLAEEPVTASASTTPPVPKKAPAFGSDDEGEDSEEEALWSKILGK